MYAFSTFHLAYVYLGLFGDTIPWGRIWYRTGFSS